jgi:hypothetical protein
LQPYSLIFTSLRTASSSLDVSWFTLSLYLKAIDIWQFSCRICCT